MFYTRAILNTLEKELVTKENLVITGMRQVGKTTILKHLFSLIKSSNKVFLDLENPLYRKIFEEEDYNAIWNNLQTFGITKDIKVFIFLDEVQNLPDISRVAKYLYDHWDVKFIMTGSSSFYLHNLFPESMAGRKLVFEIFPLTFSEFLLFKGVQRSEIEIFKDKAKRKNKISHERLLPYYREFVEFGGFPAVALEAHSERKKALLLEIFKSYFEQDAKKLADFADMSKLRDLILLLVSRIGSQLDVTKLANSLAVSRETIYSYLSFLEQTYFITLLPKFTKSVDRQSAGSQKLYFCDSGMANALGQVSYGQLFEQNIFQNLRGRYKINYFRKNGSEIDLILDGKIALEVKMSASKQDISHLKARVEGLSISEFYVISQQYDEYKEVILATDL